MRMLIVLLFIPLLGLTQIDSVKRADVPRFADGVIYTYISPVRWKSKDWLKFGGVVATTAALSMADRPVRSFWKGKEDALLDGINEVGDYYGRTYSGVIFAGGFYLSGVIINNDWAQETGLILGTALFSSDFLETAVKFLTGRARPGIERGNYYFSPFNKEVSFHSFPSGHVTTAFTISLVMAQRSKKVPIKIFFYSLAASTAFCRLYSDAHWLSDVAFGGILAWYCSTAAIHRLQTNRFKNPNKKFFWAVNPSPAGISLRAIVK